MAELSALRRDVDAALSMLPRDHGLIAWSVPVDYAGAATLMSSLGAGVLFLTRLRRVPGSTITNMHVHLSAAGVTLSNCYGALFTGAGVRLGQTADQSTAWQSSGYKTMPLAGGSLAFAGPADLYAGLWYNGTTAPTLIRSGSGFGGSSTVGQIAGQYNAASADTGLTTIAPASLGAQTPIAVRYWVGLS